MTPSFDETEDALFNERFVNLNDSTEEGGHDAKPYVIDFMRASRKRFIGHLKGEIENLKGFIITKSVGGREPEDFYVLSKEHVLALLSTNQ